jgi:hypothetical protein
MDASSADASFESAIDESLVVGTLSPVSRPRTSDITDPFVVYTPRGGSPLKNEVEVDRRTEEQESESGSSGDEDSVEFDPVRRAHRDSEG